MREMENVRWLLTLRKHRCPLCQKRFVFGTALRLHLDDVHPNLPLIVRHTVERSLKDNRILTMMSWRR